MKKIVTLLISLTLVSFFSLGIDTLKVNSQIEDVTVFFQGAQITRQAKINVIKGKYLIVINKLPLEINPQSIQVDNNQKGKILSVKHEFTYPNEKSKTIREYENKIEAQENRYKTISNELNVFDIEERILLENSNFNSKDKGATIAEIKEAAAFYREKLNEIRREKLNRAIEKDEIKQNIKDLYLELNASVWEDNKAYSKISILLDCKTAVKTDFKISYFVPSAGWDPLYDFRIESIQAPLSLVYNSNIYQSTGEDWKNVNIMLSTNAPSIVNDKPELEPWFINRANPVAAKVASDGQSALKGVITDRETGDAVPFTNVVVSKNGVVVAGSTSDFDGNYLIKPIPSGTYTIKTSSMGYTSAQINNVLVTDERVCVVDIRLSSSSVQLDEYVVTQYQNRLIDKGNTAVRATVTSENFGNMAVRSSSSVAKNTAGVYSADDGSGSLNIRGARSDANYYYIDGMKVLKNEGIVMEGYSSNTNVTSLQYKIDIPYSIPSDGKDYTVKIKEVTMPVAYVFYATPKLEKDVFLVAKISNWSQLNLLSGNTSVYYQGIFTGQSKINANSVQDTLSISLNRDQGIIVERTLLKEKNEKQKIGKNIKETISWNITVKNNKNVKANLVVEDQIPISEIESVVIEQLDLSNGIVNKKTGKVTWDLQLEPNEKIELVLKYSIKYPGHVQLIIE